MQKNFGSTKPGGLDKLQAKVLLPIYLVNRYVSHAHVTTLLKVSEAALSTMVYRSQT